MVRECRPKQIGATLRSDELTIKLDDSSQATIRLASQRMLIVLLPSATNWVTLQLRKRCSDVSTRFSVMNAMLSMSQRYRMGMWLAGFMSMSVNW